MRKIAFAATILTAVSLFSVAASAARQDGEKSEKELTGVVNINTASVQQLVLLPGVGETIARRIIDYRAQKSFKKIDELRDVKGIGERTFQKISRFLSVSGPTTLAEAPRTAHRELPKAQLAPAALDIFAHA